jgi:hypothetical protein
MAPDPDPDPDLFVRASSPGHSLSSMSSLGSRDVQPFVHTAKNQCQKQIFPENELRDHSPNFHIHVSVSDLYIPTIDLPVLLQENTVCGPILGKY